MRTSPRSGDWLTFPGAVAGGPSSTGWSSGGGAGVGGRVGGGGRWRGWHVSDRWVGRWGGGRGVGHRIGVGRRGGIGVARRGFGSAGGECERQQRNRGGHRLHAFGSGRKNCAKP